jgi:hypothetical protein
MSTARLFISYSHKDADWFVKVQDHLALLRMQGNVTAWSDRDILPGDSWNQEIETALREASIAVLLVSPHFLASEFIMRKELPHLMATLKRVQAGNLRRIMPLILEPCVWQSVPELKELEVRPKGHELSAGTEHQQNADLVDFAQSVSRLLFESAKPTETHIPGGAITRIALLGAKGYATLELRLSHCEWNRYQVRMSFTWSGDRKWDFAKRYDIGLDLDSFAAIEDAEAYAQALRDAVFPDEAAWDAVMQARARVEEIPDVTLRVRLCIEPSARELHSLNWEKLTTWGSPKNPFACEVTAFARYALGYGGISRPAFIRRRVVPKALLLGVAAVAPERFPDGAPDCLEDTATLFAGAGIDCTTLAGSWHTSDQLKELLRSHDGIDYLYLVMHDGETPSGVPAGSRAGLRHLGAAFDAMERPPRLVVMEPAVYGRQTGAQGRPWQLHAAHDVLEHGVMSVLTLQAPLARDAWHAFLTEFFGELIAHGQTDLAARSARMKMGAAPSAWAPMIASRLRSARVWYEPNLMNQAHRDQTWELLIERINEQRCIPIIGPGVDYRVARFRQEIAREWAERYQYPFALVEQVNLPQVAQYIAATHGDAQMEKDFTRDLTKFALKHYGHLLEPDERRRPLSAMLDVIAQKAMLQAPWDSHVVLASLPFPIYVTATFNNFLADALRRSQRPPQELLFNAATPPATLEDPTPQRPLVCHLFGRIDDIESLVLTEDDYFDFLIEFWRDRERIPVAVRRALASSSLLFLGFNLNNWDFRVLFRSLLKDQSSQKRRKQLHVAVQVDPDDDQITDPDRAREYLEEYFKGFSDKSDISLYWGATEDFLGELKSRWRGPDPCPAP